MTAKLLPTSFPKPAKYMVGGGIAVLAGVILPVAHSDFGGQVSILQFARVDDAAGPIAFVISVLATTIAIIPVENHLPKWMRGKPNPTRQKRARKLAPYFAGANLLITIVVLAKMSRAAGLAFGSLILLGGTAAQLYGALLYAKSIIAPEARAPQASTTSNMDGDQ